MAIIALMIVLTSFDMTDCDDYGYVMNDYGDVHSNQIKGIKELTKLNV